MRTRLTQLVEELDQCIADDIKISAEIFGLAAEITEKAKARQAKAKKKLKAAK